MAFQSPTGFDIEGLRANVRRTYDRVARNPSAEFHFHNGPRYAIDYLGYDPSELAELPEESTLRFAGVGNPHLLGSLPIGGVVLDHACGAGTDLLLAARQVGPKGKVIGVDMTPTMRQLARDAADKAGLGDRVEVRAGLMEDLPVADGTVDVVISNGVINLAPDKERVLAEVYRVLRPGGWLHAADVAVAREIKLEVRANPVLWAACIGGALVEDEFVPLAHQVGFVAAEVTHGFDCFRNTAAHSKVSPDLHVHGINFRAHKPLIVN